MSPSGDHLSLADESTPDPEERKMTDLVPGVRIDGTAVDPRERARFEVVEPATGGTLAQVDGGGPQDAQQAVSAATAALGNWSSTTAQGRADRLRAIADDLRVAAEEEPHRTLTRETGKRLPESEGEFRFAAAFFDWFANVITTEPTETWHVEPGVRHTVGWKPLGVIAVLTPWNFPISIPARKIAPALAAGCTVVFKPSQLASLSSLVLAEIVERHVPEGVMNTVCGDAKTIADVWMDDPNVRGITFTGSTGVGRDLAHRAGERLKRSTLELGGRAPFIVLDDADIEKAVEHLMVAKFRNNGQSCIAANNVWVASTLFEEFVDGFIERAGGLTVGDPALGDVGLGPVRTEQAASHLKGMLQEIAESRVVHPGNDLPDDGFFVAPSVCLEPPSDSELWRDEVFGPVTPIRSFQEVDEAIEDANASQYGLAGYVCTQDSERGAELGARLESGIVGVNVPAPNTPQIPFGGMKASGFGGYEGGRLGLQPFLDYQVIASTAS